MPWSIRKNAGKCKGSKPWAVVEKDGGKVVGCHETVEKAKKQLAALNIHVKTSEGGDAFKLSYTYISDLPSSIREALDVELQQKWLDAFLEEMNSSGDEAKAHDIAWGKVAQVAYPGRIGGGTKSVTVNMQETHYGFWHDLRNVNLDEGWMQLVPYGEYKHPVYGTLNFDSDTLAEMDKNFKDGVRGTDIDVDYDHKMDPSKGKKAAGWLKETEIRDDGLWGLVDFTDEATTEIKNKAYRYFSPEVASKWKHPKTGEVYANVLCGGGLTNRPYLKDIQPVNLSELEFDENTPTDGRALTQDEVNYRNAPDDALKCGNCSRFIRPFGATNGGYGCRRVSGEIREDGVCDIFSNDSYYWSEPKGGKAMPETKPTETPPVEPKKMEPPKEPVALSEDEVRRVLAENEDFRKQLAELQVKHRLGEINVQLSELSAIPTAAHDKLRDVMKVIPRELSDALVEALRTINETGTVPLGEVGATTKHGETETTADGTVKKFTDAVAKKMEENKELSYAGAADLVASESPQLFSEYIEASYMK